MQLMAVGDTPVRSFVGENVGSRVEGSGWGNGFQRNLNQHKVMYQNTWNHGWAKSTLRHAWSSLGVLQYLM